ncbi:unnamed protein product [Owenia fusiformis]|uniref:Uncharacterized protein n=1 Tax=Owenia fusiformis TaxID=6347 RepID=A0A8S4Q2F0_OWEFU|nr:unnamed protein product [Owenia fusiformis]
MAQNKQTVIVRYSVGATFFVAAVQQKKSFYMRVENSEENFCISEMCLRNLSVKEGDVREALENASFLPVEVEIGTGVKLHISKGVVRLQRHSEKRKKILEEMSLPSKCFVEVLDALGALKIAIDECRRQTQAAKKRKAETLLNSSSDNDLDVVKRSKSRPRRDQGDDLPCKIDLKNMLVSKTFCLLINYFYHVKILGQN